MNTLQLSIIQAAERNVCDIFNITPAELKTRSRKQEYTLARGFIYKFSRTFTYLSLEEIGRFYNRSHCTVLSGIRSIENAIETRFRNCDKIYELIIKNGFPKTGIIAKNGEVVSVNLSSLINIS
jgi:chromosomal replication initiation ATPase DnaA